MKQILKQLKPLSVLPALFLLWMIFSFSAQTGSESGGLSQMVSRWLAEGWNMVSGKHLSPGALEALAQSLEFWVRKGAHMSEYALLCWSAALPMLVYQVPDRFRRLEAPLFCALVAASDEFHQSFVPGRTPAVRDVGIDLLGALLALGLLELGLALWRRRRRRTQRSQSHRMGPID